MRYVHITEAEINCIQVNGLIPIEEVLTKIGVPNKEDLFLELHHFTHSRKAIIGDLSGKLNAQPILAITKNGTPIYGSFIICWFYRATSSWKLNGMSDSAIWITLHEIQIINNTEVKQWIGSKPN